MSTDTQISRQLRRDIARFPEEASPAEKLLFKVSALSTVASLEDPKIKQFLLPLVKSIT